MGEPVREKVHGIGRDVLADRLQLYFLEFDAKLRMLRMVLLQSRVAGRLHHGFLGGEVFAHVVLQPGEDIDAKQGALVGSGAFQFGQPLENRLVLFVEHGYVGAQVRGPFGHGANTSIMNVGMCSARGLMALHFPASAR